MDWKARLVCLALLLHADLLDLYSKVQGGVGEQLSPRDILHYRERIVNMFDHAYDGYLANAYDYDELQPLTCGGKDTWGSFSLSLIDALDTLAIMGDYAEFRRVAELVYSTISFNHNINVSVFETNIRVVGGLLSAHLLSHKAGVPLENGWPCNGPLLRMAEDLGRRLLPAFETPTGMPYGTVNLMHGVPNEETPITCSAGVGTFLVEFGALSRLTGDPIFEEKAMRAVHAMHRTRSKLDLIGNHINTTSGQWTAIESSIGAGVDSYFEYLVKGSMLLQRPHLMDLFYVYYDSIDHHMKRDDWFFMVHMNSGLTTMPVFQSLEAFWPGLLSLIGEIGQAQKSLYNYHQVWKQFGFIPEIYEVPSGSVKRDGYPLRPEFIESLFYLFKATRDPHLLMIGADIVESIEHSTKTKCGYATVKDVNDHTVEDRMESFYLAETLKYLYLLFAPEDHFIYNDGSHGTVIKAPSDSSDCILDAGGYVFNTEAHPIDAAALHCCESRREERRSRKEKVPFDFFSVFDLHHANAFPPNIYQRKAKEFHVPQEFADGSGSSAADSPHIQKTFQVGETPSPTQDKLSIILKPSTSLGTPAPDGVSLEMTSEPTFPLHNSSADYLASLDTQETTVTGCPNAISDTIGAAKKSSPLSATEFIAKVLPTQHSAQFFTHFNSLLPESALHHLPEIPVSDSMDNNPDDYELLSCAALPFFAKLSRYGQVMQFTR